MNKFKHPGIAAAIALLGSLAAQGVLAQRSDQDVAPRFSFNRAPYAVGSLHLFGPDSKFGADRRGMGATLRGGEPVTESWDVQYGTSFSRAHDSGAQVRQNTIDFDALYMFSRSRVRPFLLAGFGAEYDKSVQSGRKTSHTSPYVAIGAGVQYSFNEKWGMQLDFRRSHAYISGDDFGFNRANSNRLALGLIYVFGAPTAPVRKAPPAVAAPAKVVYVEAPAAVVAPQPAPMPPPRHIERSTFSATELFGFDSAELSMPQPKLDEIARAIKANSQINNVNVIGYTDRLGSSAYNQKLSQRRSDSVKNYLVTQGVAPSRLSSEGRGESNPVVECTDKKRSALIVCLEPNRRVEVEQIVIERSVP